MATFMLSLGVCELPPGHPTVFPHLPAFTQGLFPPGRPLRAKPCFRLVRSFLWFCPLCAFIAPPRALLILIMTVITTNQSNDGCPLHQECPEVLVTIKRWNPWPCGRHAPCPVSLSSSLTLHSAMRLALAHKIPAMTEKRHGFLSPLRDPCDCHNNMPS